VFFKGLVVLLKNLLAKHADIFYKIPIASSFDFFFSKLGQPMGKLLILSYILKHKIDHFVQDFLLIQLKRKARLQSNLSRKGANYFLEKAVDRTHRKLRIIMQDVGKHLFCSNLQACWIQTCSLAQLRHQGRSFSFRQLVQLLNDPALHLLSSLIGKGYCQDGLEVFWRSQSQF